MYALANCVVDVLRGTTEDDYGDQVDSGEVVLTDRPAQILVRNVVVTGDGTSAPRIRQVIVGAMSSGDDVRDDDQIRTNGITYAVTSVTQENGVGRTPDLALELSRLT
jgi:hypothetical protein